MAMNSLNDFITMWCYDKMICSVMDATLFFSPVFVCNVVLCLKRKSLYWRFYCNKVVVFLKSLL